MSQPINTSTEDSVPPTMTTESVPPTMTTESVVEAAAVSSFDPISGEGPSTLNDAADTPASSNAPAGTGVNTVVTITKTVTSTHTGQDGLIEAVEETASISQEFEPKDGEDDFVRDLVAMGWTPRGRPDSASKPKPQPQPRPPPTRPQTGATHPQYPPRGTR